MAQSSAILALVKDTARHPYSWPGCYPKFLLMADGGCLCPACCKSEFRSIAHATFHVDKTGGWLPLGVDINWEDDQLICDHCGKRIESAYGENES